MAWEPPQKDLIVKGKAEMTAGDRTLSIPYRSSRKVVFFIGIKTASIQDLGTSYETIE
jgi:hypothetical protein